MTYIYAPHAPQSAHLTEVAKQMEALGAPTIRAVWDGEKWIALEGSHRIAAAAQLGLTPEIDQVGYDDEIDHDFDDVPSRRVADVIEYLANGGASVDYRFDDLKRGRG